MGVWFSVKSWSWIVNVWGSFTSRSLGRILTFRLRFMGLSPTLTRIWVSSGGSNPGGSVSLNVISSHSMLPVFLACNVTATGAGSQASNSRGSTRLLASMRNTGKIVSAFSMVPTISWLIGASTEERAIISNSGCSALTSNSWPQTSPGSNRWLGVPS